MSQDDAYADQQGRPTSVILNPDGRIPIDAYAVTATGILNGRALVTTSGVPFQLAGQQSVKSVTIKALQANTAKVYVGASGILPSNGFSLAPSDTVSLDIADLSTVWVDGDVTGDGVRYIAIG